MADLSIEQEILIDAPIDVVWRTITEPDQIAQWFADRVEVDLHPGGAGTLVFEDKGTTRATTVPLVVITVEPRRRFSFRWGHPEGEDPVAGNSVLVEFTLAAESSDRTRLRVEETGLDVIGWPGERKAHYAEDHRHGWAVHIARLGDLMADPAG
jgi:uncharacterized protein YndB with AHSA1/START domain